MGWSGRPPGAVVTSQWEKDKQKICKIPEGVDLHVYFNRFVSSEGTGEDLPFGGLVDEDFIPETGEPKLTQKVFDKIGAIGRELCVNGTIKNGGAFGDFLPQPHSGHYRQEGDPEESRYYSIVDSKEDGDNASESGANYFFAGLKWNHHYYCAD